MNPAQFVSVGGVFSNRDHVAVAVAGAAQGPQFVEDVRLKRASLGPGAAALALRCRMAGYHSPFDHLGFSVWQS